MKKVIDTFEPRIDLILWDTDFFSVLIRDNPSPGQLKVCLINYEFCRYDNLVNDITIRFANQLFDFAGKEVTDLRGKKFLKSKRGEFLSENI